MKQQPGFTDFFMSPVTGRIILPMMPDLYQDYVWIGNRGDRPLPSPIIIDLRLEIVDIRRRLSQTRFILQAASKDFDSSQALNELIPGILKHNEGIVDIAIPWVDYVPVDLPYRNIWIGDEESIPQPYPRIFLENLPSMLSADPTKLLGAYNLYRGSPDPLNLGIPEIIKTLHITNMADLPEGHLWLGTNSLDPLNFGLNRPVPIIVLPLANMADLPERNIWIGNGGDRPEPYQRVFLENLPSMLSDDPAKLLGAYNLYRGSPNPLTLGIPEIVKTLHITNMADLPEGHLWLGTDSSDPVNSGTDRPVPIVVLPLANMADLPYNKIWRGTIGDRPFPSDALTDVEEDITTINENITNINTELGDINIEIGDINTELGDINIEIGDINLNIDSIFDSLFELNVEIGDINVEIGDINIELGDINIHLGGLDGSILDLQAQIDANVASGLDHLADLQLQIDTAISSGMDHLTIINGRLDALELSVTTINTTIATIQTDILAIQSAIATINTLITSIQSDITSLYSSIATINTTITAIQGDITALYADIATINTTITSIQGDITSIYSDIDTINTTITTIQSDITEINTLITDIQSQIDTINTTITSLQSQIDTINTTITTINTTITDIQSQIDTISSTIIDIQGDITVIQDDITNITTVLLPAIYTYIDTSVENITNNFIAGGVIDMNNNRVINLPCDPVEDNDAVSFCFLWHTLHDEVTISWP